MKGGRGARIHFLLKEIMVMAEDSMADPFGADFSKLVRFAVFLEVT